MTENENFIGLMIWLVFVILGLFKKLRSNKAIIFSLFLSGLIAIVPITTMLGHESTAENLNQNNGLLLPFIYVVLYGSLRMLYKRIYHREPTYYRADWYDPEDARNQNLLDVIVYIIPMILSIGIVYMLT